MPLDQFASLPTLNEGVEGVVTVQSSMAAWVYFFGKKGISMKDEESLKVS
jgi:hypothetical protein